MTFTPEQVAERLLEQCYGHRKNAAQLAERNACATFTFMPHASSIWRAACEILEKEPVSK